MRYFVRMAYDGSKFHGFQRLSNDSSVQKRLEDALSFIDHFPVAIKGAGRTDAGVHAYGQCAHFDLHIDFEPQKLKQVLNKMIGPYIVLTEVKKVSDTFHARFDVVEKHYQYRVYLGSRNPFLEDYVLHYPYELNIAKMKKGSAIFIGTHNFQNFVAGSRRNYQCILRNIDIKREDDMILIDFYGASFYRYMVRNLVGALLMLSRDKISLEDIQNALNFPEIEKDFWTAPSNGLYLMDIKYKDKENRLFNQKNEFDG